MPCCCRNKNTKPLALHFKREELLYDIANIAYVEGDVMQTDDEHQRHQVFDICEDGNINRVTRVLNLAFAHCAELCRPLSKRPAMPYVDATDTLTATDVYVMDLRVPEKFSYTTHRLMEHLIHEIMCYKVLADWLSITAPGAEAKWLAKIEELESQLKEAVNANGGRTRRPLSPW